MSIRETDFSHFDNLAITGANGFVGRSVVEFLGTLAPENLPNQITLITRHGLNFQLPKNLIEISKSSLQDLTLPWQIPGDVSQLLNLAADGSKDPYSEGACVQFETISRNLVDWVQKSETPKKIFHASSGACFGQYPIDPNNPPTDSKVLFKKNRVEVEEYLIDSSQKVGFELSIGRLFSFSGKNLLSKRQYALSSFVDSAVGKGKIIVLGNPLTQRSYLHQSSMSEWILKSLVTQESYMDLEIGSNEAVTIEELAEFIAGETNASVEYSTFPPSGDIYVPNNKNTRIKLGVDEGLHWKEAVVEMISEAETMSYD
jgi:nucleoside-diphosphate-sugar epimerase